MRIFAEQAFIMDFPHKIIDWYKKNKRDLPWRHTKEPYQIWVSEVILQQTRVNQGLAYYYRFLEAFPDIGSLANAPLDKVLKQWEGLGYYSRARNMHEAAIYLCTTYQGKFPPSYKELLSVKGIGPYTAAAIASFCYNEPVAVCDGNVMRVLSRFLGIRTPIDTTQGKKQLLEAAQMLIPPTKAGLFNQAIMEFGALHCKPAQPDCEACPLHTVCHAFAKKCVRELPVKAGKKKLRVRYLYYMLLDDGKHIIVQQRSGNDIWKQLYELPLIETERPISRQVLQRAFAALPVYKPESDIWQKTGKPIKHVLSHQLLHIYFIEVRMAVKRKVPLPYKKITYAAAGERAFPIVLKKYLNEKGFL